MTSIKKESIDTEAKKKERFKKLKEIIETILAEVESADALRKQALWFYLYLMWHESQRGTKRAQTVAGGGKGLARGLMQYQPNRIRDALENICKHADKGKIIENLAAAAGVKKEEMQKTIDDYKKDYDQNTDEKGKRKNEWPKKADGSNIPKWLEDADSFGIKLMYYDFSMTIGAGFPDKCDDLDAQFKCWYDNWNKGGKKDKKKGEKEKNFKADANDLAETADCGKKKKEELKTKIEDIKKEIEKEKEKPNGGNKKKIEEVEKKIEEVEKKVEEFDKEEDLDKLDEAKKLVDKAKKAMSQSGNKTKFMIIGGIIVASLIILAGILSTIEWNR